MYCPNCKNEYRKGIEICPECHVELVAELTELIDWTELFRSEDETMVNEVGRYFRHIGLKYDILTDEETAELIFNVAEKELKKAKMEAATVIKVYHDNKAQAVEASDETVEDDFTEDSEEEEVEAYKEPEKAYVSVKDRTNDYKSSGILFIIMGIVLVVVSILNYMEKLNIFPARISQIVMLVLGIACVVGGIASVIRSRSLSKEVAGEEDLINKIKAELNEKYPPLTFAEMMEDSDTTPELRYIQVQEEIKKYMASVFPEASSRMLDDFIEEYTDSMFN